MAMTIRRDPLGVLMPEGGWRAGFDVVVSGHTHVPRLERHASSGVLMLNPGSCGPKRFSLPRQCAVALLFEAAEPRFLRIDLAPLASGQEPAIDVWLPERMIGSDNDRPRFPPGGERHGKKPTRNTRIIAAEASRSTPSSRKRCRGASRNAEV